MSTSRLQEKYKSDIAKELMTKFNYSNVMQVPKLRKIVVSMGFPAAGRDNKVVDESVEEMGLITGQKPAFRRAKKSIAGFHVREGMIVGSVVTLRGQRMYEFLDRLVSLALPRIRDFRGLSKKSFDGHGGYSMGIEEHSIFTEVKVEKVLKSKGMNIAFDTSAKTDEESMELLKLFGMPFRQ